VLNVLTKQPCGKPRFKFELLFFSSSAVFSSSPGSNGNSRSWSSLGLEGDMYEENLSFPTSDRLVELRI